MDIKKVIDPSKYDIGVIVGRYQVKNLHKGQIQAIDFVCSNHKKVIIFLGVARAQSTQPNPMDFATREAMVQKLYPNVTILPQLDQLVDEVWSANLDAQIALPFGEKRALLYGSRDSFIPHYHGKHATTELTTTIHMSGTEQRAETAKEILNSPEFRHGVIHSVYAQRPVTYPTVDVVAYNGEGQILLARKPNEKKFRFVGGFVDRGDVNFEMSARREFSEETTCHIQNLRYMFSHKVNDWRYGRGEKSGIMTTLFLGSFGHGRPTPKDDIEELKWEDISKYTNGLRIKNDIEEVHQEMMAMLVEKIYKEKLVPNLGEFYKKKVEPIDPDVVVKDTTHKIIR